MMNKKINKRIIVFLTVFVMMMTFFTVIAKAEDEYTIQVDVTLNVVTVFQNGEPIKAMTCSTGSATPRSGTYRTSDKYEWRTLIGGVSGQYATRITGQILFHSVPYTRYGDKSSLEYWEYDKLGSAASLGCVRLSVADAKWIYDNCPSGMSVTFTTSGSAPLGKPKTYKIADAPADVIGWDPTDPDENNPWLNNYQGVCFDADYYREKYEELSDYSDLDLRVHWITTGIKEGKQASEGFDVNYYKNANTDLKEEYGDDNYSYVSHYITTGAAEGREAVEAPHEYIKGKCQMPYKGEGGGYLIGVETYDNPNQSYMYEMLILDCTLLAQDKPAWIYTTGQCGVASGNALWTVWQPQYGYYWTLFRIYDKDGNMIDEACYGFANIY